jgi:triosephosphate isomerase
MTIGEYFGPPPPLHQFFPNFPPRRPPSVIQVAKLTKDVLDVDIALFPPHPFLVPVFAKVEATNVKIGGQNCFFENEGAYTGAVSTCMLKDVGATYVLCGHSERRTMFRDDDGAIGKKVKKVLRQGLKPVLCIGESRYPSH